MMRMNPCCFFLVLALPILAGAAVTENFDGFTDSSYEGLDDYGVWTATNIQAYAADGKPRGGTGKCLVFDDDAGGWLVYEGADGAGKDGGLGTVSLWYRHWDGDANSVAFQVQYRQGGGSWINVGSQTSATATNYTQFSADVNQAGDNYQVRVLSMAYAERLCIDDVYIGDYGGGSGDDPNLSVATSMNFGLIDPGMTATQQLAVSNTGLSNTLTLAAFSPSGGDTNRFAVGTLPSPLAPGAASNINVVYHPGFVTGASHSATFKLISNDPSSPTQTVTFTGQTAAGSLTVSNVQYSSSGGASPLNGTRVYLRGIVSYADPNGYGLSDAGGGSWSGVYVADQLHRPNTGDLIYLEGLVQEPGSMTVLTNASRYSVAATGRTVPLTTIRGNQLNTEAYEGVLVRITNVTVKSTNYGGGRVYWQAGDPAGNFLVAA